jgi:NADP-dependent 3-hydroxy acid dehydrogenase YdfG
VTNALHHRRILVTGASSGIGHAVVRACSADGANVVALARRESRLAELAEETGAVPVCADVADGDAAERAVTDAAAAMGGLDAVVNCAGSMRLGSVERTDPSVWREMFDVNVFGLLNVTKAAIPLLREAGRGDIVNVSSMAGKRVPDAMGGMYAASKAAVNAISETLRRELHGSGIRISVVSPGKVETELRDHISAEQLKLRARKRSPVVGLPADAVAAVITAALAAPPDINQYEITVLPTSQGLD